MPSRFATGVIVLAWLAMSAWLVQRDLWPRLRARDAPPLVLDVHDEESDSLPVRWVVSRDRDLAQVFGRLVTQVAYRKADDRFVLESTFTQDPAARLFHLDGLALRIHNQEVVTREGDLLGLVADLEASSPAGPLALHIQGEVRDGRFHARARFNDTDLPPTVVPVRHRGNLLLPLHPVHRLAGVHGGQRWQVMLVNPVQDLFQAMVREHLPLMPASLGPTVLSAEVQPVPVDLAWGGHTHRCWVIEYQGGDEDRAWTWVRVADGFVVRQEARRGQETLVLQRQGL